MYTRCPQCQTVFRITAAQLKARDGQVRCGRCQNVFRGDQHLVDRPERKVERPVGAPRKRSSRKPAKPAAPDTSTIIPDLGTAATAAVAPTARDEHALAHRHIMRPSQAVPDDATQPAVLLHPKRAGTGALFWGISSLLLVILLLAQAVVFYGAQLVRAQPALKPAIELACRTLPCRHRLVIDMHRLDLVDSAVTPHPRYDRALHVRATLVNRAEYVQPYPLLEVTLLNSQGQVVARRAYKPSEYLPKPQRVDAGLLPQVAVAVKLDITGPGAEASGYEILLLPPSE